MDVDGQVMNMVVIQESRCLERKASKGTRDYERCYGRARRNGLGEDGDREQEEVSLTAAVIDRERRTDDDRDRRRSSYRGRARCSPSPGPRE